MTLLQMMAQGIADPAPRTVVTAGVGGHSGLEHPVKSEATRIVATTRLTDRLER